MARADPLKTYRSKRNFAVTSEPAEGGKANEAARAFVVQKHWASRLHYDFRLELDGAMKSWAVPKGPSYDSTDKRMAVHVEDHPISYNEFEGEIPPKQYGAGKVIIWDKGTWVPLGNARKDYKDGKLKFELHGHKLRGKWALIRMKGKAEKQEPWLLIKEKDEYVRSSMDFSVVDEMPDSVAHLDGAAEKVPNEILAATKSASKKSARKAATSKTSSRKVAALPETLKPELATLVDSPPADSSDWVFEIKFDGYRLLARIEGKNIRLYTRNGNDWSAKLPHILQALAKLKLPDGWYDGEIVVPDDRGIPDFQALQNAFDIAKTSAIVYYLFDMPFSGGEDLRAIPLSDRRERLRQILERKSSDFIRYSETIDAGARDIVASACKMGLEGVIGKRKTSGYMSQRSPDWIKLKCSLRQEFVIGGYTDPQGSRTGLGSLLLGVHDETGKLRYAGNVGTGFNSKTLADLKRRLESVHAQKSPFAEPTDIDRKAHWVKPALVAEVSFGQWTKTGRIRHSVFQGLRTDKPPKEITRESSMPMDKPAVPDAFPGQVKVSHPERVVDPSTNTLKVDIVRYYGLVGPLMMEHLEGRPVSLVRAPDGIGGDLFFQKHLETAKMKGIRQLSPDLDPEHAPLMEVASPLGLLSAAQMNVIEFHTWNAVKSVIDRPDRMTFDLDPGKGVEWATMQEAALVLRGFLNELGLASFVKTSGGKGLHVVVPVKRRHEWYVVKDFSQAVVLHMAETLPKRFTAKSGPRNRVGKIFIDYLRNGFGATTVAAWSARARPGMGVSVPVAWEEVEKLSGSAQWHVSNIHERLDVGNEPWKDYDASAKTLTSAMKILGFRPDRPG